MQSLSRRSPRYRIDTAATAVPLLGGDIAACRTLDVSESGLSLDTAAWFPLGTRLAVALVDPTTGSAIEVIGDVVREAAPPSWTLGILLIDPPLEWQGVVAAAARRSTTGPAPSRSSRTATAGSSVQQASAAAIVQGSPAVAAPIIPSRITRSPRTSPATTPTAPSAAAQTRYGRHSQLQRRSNTG